MTSEFGYTRMDLSVGQIDLVIEALLNNAINKKLVNNVKKLFDAFDPSTYQTDYEKEYRVFLVKNLSKCILENNVDTKLEIITLVSFDGKFAVDCNNLLLHLKEEELTDKELISADKLVSKKLQLAAINAIAEPFISAITALKDSTFEDFDDAMSKCEIFSYKLNKTLAEVRDSTIRQKNTISFENTSAVLADLDVIIKDAKNPAKKVRTGLQCMNLLLNGGFESGRSYCVLGVAKGWKSGFLLNTCIWAKKYNNLVSKDPNKRPIILYLTLENSKKETEQRLITYAMGPKAKQIKELTKEEIGVALQNAGIINRPDDPATTPTIMVQYAKPKSMSPNDINIYIDDLAKEGKEVVFLVVDYLKRLKANERNKEARIEYGNIADELTTMAKDLDIPVVFAMQLNREAIKMFTDSEDNFTATLQNIKKINSSNIGESIDVVQNVDAVFSVALVSDKKKDEMGIVEHSDNYLQIKALESRTGTNTGNNLYYQRFSSENMMMLSEDCNSNTMSALTQDQLQTSKEVDVDDIKIMNRK